METLTQESIRWAASVGISPERAAFLAACPKYTRSGTKGREHVFKDTNPNHHLQKLGACWWIRLRRRGLNIVENIGGDLTLARMRRDEMLAAFDAGKPVPYVSRR